MAKMLRQYTVFKNSRVFYSVKPPTHFTTQEQFINSLTPENKRRVLSDLAKTIDNTCRWIEGALFESILVLGGDFGSITRTLSDEYPNARIDTVNRDPIACLSTALQIHSDNIRNLYGKAIRRKHLHDTYDLIVIATNELSLSERRLLSRVTHTGTFVVIFGDDRSKRLGRTVGRLLAKGLFRRDRFVALPSSHNMQSMVELNYSCDIQFRDSILKYFSRDHVPSIEQHKIHKMLSDRDISAPISVMSVIGPVASPSEDKLLAYIWQHRRHTKYQISTKIVQHNDNSRTVYKTSEHISGSSHIESMLSNYSHLVNAFSDTLLKVVEPTLIHPSRISFPYIDGMNLESIIFDSLSRGDFNTAIQTIRRVFAIIDKSGSQISAGQEFGMIFRGSYAKEVDILPVGIIDLNMNNFILDENDVLWLIDYEWVLEEPVPLAYAKTRMLSYFFKPFLDYFKDYGSTEDWLQIRADLIVPHKVLDTFPEELSMSSIDRAEKSERLFQKMVYPVS